MTEVTPHVNSKVWLLRFVVYILPILSLIGIDLLVTISPMDSLPRWCLVVVMVVTLPFIRYGERKNGFSKEILDRMISNTSAGAGSIAILFGFRALSHTMSQGSAIAAVMAAVACIPALTFASWNIFEGSDSKSDKLEVPK